METNKRTILITGGAKGLGKYLAEHLSNEGHDIIIADIQPLENVPEVYRASIHDYFEIDLSDYDAAKSILENIMVKYKIIDVLINNASIRIFKDYVDFDELDIEKYINVNFRVPIFLIKKLYPMMKKNGYGRIINIASISAYKGYISGTMYCSTKSALVKFTEAFGRELKDCEDNVTVNVIVPDAFSTVEGEKLEGYDHITRSIAKTIDEMLVSDRNGQVIPVLMKRTKFVYFLSNLKQVFKIKEIM